MSHGIDETYSVYEESWRTARKPHCCAACDDTILVGHRYCSVHIVFDRRAETVKRCVKCQRLHEHLRELGAPREMWPDERLGCGLLYEDEWGPVPEEIVELSLMTPGAAQGLAS